MLQFVFVYRDESRLWILGSHKGKLKLVLLVTGSPNEAVKRLDGFRAQFRAQWANSRNPQLS